MIKTMMQYILILFIVIFYGGKRKFQPKNSDTEFFIMACHRDIVYLFCLLYSFYSYIGYEEKITINTDGTITFIDRVLLHFFFKNISLLTKKDFLIVEKKLSSYPKSILFYKTWMGKKFFNPLLFSSRKKIVLLDSDMFFIKKPKEIIHFIQSSQDINMYEEDPPDFFLLSEIETKKVFDFHGKRDVLNSSLLCLRKKYIPSFLQMEKTLVKIYSLQKERIMDFSYLLEQTMFMYIYSKIPLKKKKMLSMEKYMNMAILHSDNILKTDSYSLHFPTPSKNKLLYYFFLHTVHII